LFLVLLIPQESPQFIGYKDTVQVAALVVLTKMAPTYFESFFFFLYFGGIFIKNIYI